MNRDANYTSGRFGTLPAWLGAPKNADQGILFDGSLFDEDPEFLVEIVNLFLATYSDLLSDIDAALLRQDSEGLRRAAHTMKGAVSNFGAKAIVEQAMTIEDIGRSGDLTVAWEPAHTLRTLLDKFAPQLEEAAETALVSWSLGRGSC